MSYQKFNIDLRPNISKKKFQPVFSGAFSKCTFLLLGRFLTKQVNSNPNLVTIKSVNFKLKYLDNDIKYLILKGNPLYFKEDMGNGNWLPAIKLCVKISNTPYYEITKMTKLENYELEIGTGKGELRVHLSFSKDCENTSINIGKWPCVTNSIY